MSGDTLSEIAAKYDTTYLKLAQINNISNPDLIYPGQVIQIG
nr:LysM domain-containing protein [Clostridium sp. C105KSO13]